MNQVRRDNLLSVNLHRFGDMILVSAGLVLAYVVKERLEIGIPTDPLTARVVLASVAMVSLCWLAVTSAMETYVYKRKLFDEVVNLTAALALTIVFFLALVYFTRIFVFPRWLIVLWSVVGTALFVIARTVKIWMGREFYRKGYMLRRVVIVGATDAARRLAEMFRREPTLGFQFCGFIVADRERPEGLEPVLGRMDEIASVLDAHRIQEVLVALPGHDHDHIVEIAHRCQNHHVRLHIVPDVLEVVMTRASFTEIGDIPLIGLRDPAIRGYQSFVKRAFDVAVASFCTLLFSPFFLIISILIRLDSGGKVFFIQRRAGVNGRPFDMYKFRTMVEGAEEQLESLIDVENLEEPVYKLTDDPRVTRIGRFLRRTSLDELPQLLNVLKGDMSMVGPRPEALNIVSRYSLKNRRRLSVKPGITGPMQVNGRADLSFEERLKLELGYIARYSLLDDIKYLLRTIPAVYHGKGAY